LVHSAFDVLLRARCDALQAALTNMCEHSDAIQPTAEAVRKFVDDRTRAIVDNELARLADDDMARVSLIRRMLGSIFQKEN